MKGINSIFVREKLQFLFEKIGIINQVLNHRLVIIRLKTKFSLARDILITFTNKGRDQ